VNNPVNFIDPDGRSSSGAIDKMYEVGGNWTNVGYGWFNNRSGQYMDYEGNILEPSGVLETRSFLTGGGGAGAGGGFVQNYFDNGGSALKLLSLVDQLKKADWEDPINTKAEFEDYIDLVNKVPALAELFKMTGAGFREDFSINNAAVTREQTIFVNINNISNILSYAMTLGHEMYGHVFANIFFKSKFSEVTNVPQSSPRSFNFFQEVMGVSWEISMGETRYGNISAWEATSKYYGPNGMRHEQSIINRVNKDFNRLLYEWKNIYNVEKNKLK
ncbi:MAG: hypothetical protein K0M56_02320, partial [Kaistella sp.]|nr:hypothetical protein [Kaistella sp.]